MTGSTHAYPQSGLLRKGLTIGHKKFRFYGKETSKPVRRSDDSDEE